MERDQDTAWGHTHITTQHAETKHEDRIHGLVQRTNFSTLPKEFCPWWAKLEDSANQTLSLIKRWRGSGEVQFTVWSIPTQQGGGKSTNSAACFTLVMVPKAGQTLMHRHTNIQKGRAEDNPF